MLCPLQSISLGSFYFVTYFSFELRYFPELTHSVIYFRRQLQGGKVGALKESNKKEGKTIPGIYYFADHHYGQK